MGKQYVFGLSINVHYGVVKNVTDLFIDFTGNNSLTPSGTNCVCPDTLLTYTCNISGGGATVWRGTTLSCVRSDVTVRHDSDNFVPGTFELCGGAIIREIVGIEGDDCHITRLNFTAANQFNDTITECLIQDPEVTSVGRSTIFIIPGTYMYIWAWVYNIYPTLVYTSWGLSRIIFLPEGLLGKLSLRIPSLWLSF